MGKIFNAPFEQVADIVDEKILKDYYEKAEDMSLGKRLLMCVFMVGGLQLMYWMINLLGAHLDEAIIPLDLSNEYIQWAIPVWLIHGLSLYCVVDLLFFGTLYRKRDNIKLAFRSNLAIASVLIALMFIIFKMTQLLMVDKYLRLFYTGLFIFSWFFGIWRSKSKLTQMIYGENKIDKLTSFWINHWQKIVSILSAILFIKWVSSFFINFESVNGFKEKMIFMLLPFFPLIVSLSIGFGLPILIRSITRMYYVNKYSEDFRVTFGVSHKQWYGSKSKEYQLEQEIK